MEMISLSTGEKKQIDDISKYHPKIKDLFVYRHTAVAFEQHMWVFGTNTEYSMLLQFKLNTKDVISSCVAHNAIPNTPPPRCTFQQL